MSYRLARIVRDVLPSYKHTAFYEYQESSGLVQVDHTQSTAIYDILYNTMIAPALSTVEIVRVIYIGLHKML